MEGGEERREGPARTEYGSATVHFPFKRDSLALGRGSFKTHAVSWKYLYVILGHTSACPRVHQCFHQCHFKPQGENRLQLAVSFPSPDRGWAGRVRRRGRSLRHPPTSETTYREGVQATHPKSACQGFASHWRAVSPSECPDPPSPRAPPRAQWPPETPGYWAWSLGLGGTEQGHTTYRGCSPEPLGPFPSAPSSRCPGEGLEPLGPWQVCTPLAGHAGGLVTHGHARYATGARSGLTRAGEVRRWAGSLPHPTPPPARRGRGGGQSMTQDCQLRPVLFVCTICVFPFTPTPPPQLKYIFFGEFFKTL